MTKRSWWWIGSLTAFAALAVVSWYARYDIHDWLVLRNYSPSVAVEKLATNSGMDDYGRRLFYVNDPQLNDKEDFNSNCSQYEKTIVLGCFTGTNIYIYDVENEELDGIKEVTAAHEMLHAAYERLQPKEQKNVDKMVLDMYSRISDSRISELVKSYESQNPEVVPNELHSILATEIRKLTPELEEYYSQYFDDRLSVVQLAEEYEEVFNEAKNEAETVSAELSLRKVEIDDAEENLVILEVGLNESRQQLNTERSNGNVATYNSLVPVYNQKVNEYNQEVARVKGLISKYNQLVIDYNELAVYQQGLVQSIDSKFEPTQ